MLPRLSHRDRVTGLRGLANDCGSPPYPDMITEAIGALKENDGSSKRAISKYIELTYNRLPLNHDELLSDHLRRLKNESHLIMVKKSYKPANSAGSAASLMGFATYNLSDASPTSKSGRDCPPKPKPTVPAADSHSQSLNAPVADEPKKFVGRPRKNGPIGQVGVRKGPGCYVGVAPATTTVDAPSLPRPRGRPKGTTRATSVTAVLGKRRGRPPRVGGNTEPQPPKKTTGMPQSKEKQAVEALSIVMGAVQDLEGLAAIHHFEMLLR
ncbi:hypothetical protein F3Y22_tig00116967pilonHSYRG00020 [Hibiscus syriacus]|uniref:H15 domain-containing protein n=1 Tax=Hibiscus syriacus TaxID=106335 RepID=A0A6A2X9Q6_HIBSY|nr:hypothetical protein F3Y22_tig00116967pilonHSYRG00020 [Hibiscus syriacus]